MRYRRIEGLAENPLWDVADRKACRKSTARYGIFIVYGMMVIFGSMLGGRLNFFVFIVYGMMVMIMKFVQAIGDEKATGISVMLIEVIFFMPTVTRKPDLLGGQSIWDVLPFADGVVVLPGIRKYFAAVEKGMK